MSWLPQREHSGSWKLVLCGEDRAQVSAQGASEHFSVEQDGVQIKHQDRCWRDGRLMEKAGLGLGSQGAGMRATKETERRARAEARRQDSGVGKQAESLQLWWHVQESRGKAVEVAM